MNRSRESSNASPIVFLADCTLYLVGYIEFKGIGVYSEIESHLCLGGAMGA